METPDGRQLRRNGGVITLLASAVRQRRFRRGAQGPGGDQHLDLCPAPRGPTQRNTSRRAQRGPRRRC
eukprot:6292878-Pyramimonas_sp.AAC.1